MGEMLPRFTFGQSTNEIALQIQRGRFEQQDIAVDAAGQDLFDEP